MTHNTSCQALYTDGLVRAAASRFEPPVGTELKRQVSTCSTCQFEVIDQVHFTALYPQPRAIRDYRTIRKLLLRLGRPGAARVWRRMKASVAALFRRAHSSTQTKPELCYKLYGVDLMLDQNHKPWVLEVNRSPDMFFYTEREDREVKSRIIQGVVAMMAAPQDHLSRIANNFSFEIL